jgi:autotransporter-associated beta strand protein
LIVDAGVTAPASGSFPAIVASTWTGIPGDTTDGTKVNASVLNANIQYVINATANRTSDQATAAYLDDRRNKGYSVTDGMGPLTSVWRAAAQQTTSITGVAADATTVLYSDTGNNLGVGSSVGNTTFGTVVDFLNSPANGSTEPAKRFYKYARPWRWSSSVSVVPALVPAESATPGTDSGYISGHAAEATRDALGMAYVVPERYQEMLSRALELGENRIFAGMHSPLDVIAGRMQAEAIIAANLYAESIQSTTNPDGSTSAVTDMRSTAYTQAHTALMAAVGASNQTSFNSFAHSGAATTDRFSNWSANQANYLRRLTYGFSQIGDTTQSAQVPKGAELLLETRLPYLTATQRRVVLKSTALPSGYPVMDDAEGWGRLNLFAAADGYGNFNGDVSVAMDATQGGFNASDSWKNNISGPGMLTLNGTGTLHLTGNNSYTGGTILNGGTLEGDSVTAFGSGDVYVAAGTLRCNASGTTAVAGNFSQLAAGTLQVTIGALNQGALSVANVATLAGTLNVTFAPGFTPSVGNTLTIITTGGSLQGTFSTVTVNGYKVTPIYTSHGMQIQITG